MNISSNYDHTIISEIFNDEMSPIRKYALMKYPTSTPKQIADIIVNINLTL